jgi:hypothetical protein
MDLGFRWAGLGFWGSYGWIAGPKEDGLGAPEDRMWRRGGAVARPAGRGRMAARLVTGGGGEYPYGISKGGGAGRGGW